MKKITSSKLIIIATVVGICLVAKVYIIRKILHVEVNVQDIVIPGIFLVLYEYIHQIAKRKKLSEEKLRLLIHPLYWSIAIIVLTSVSLYWYLS